MVKQAAILTVGGSPEPLIYFINEYEPDFIYLLHSDKSIKEAKRIVDELKISKKRYSFKLIEDSESLEVSYLKSKEIIDELKSKNYDVHVDFTGGTKPMVSGLILAAVMEECTYSYIGSDTAHSRDKNGLGVVKSGFEKLKLQTNPYSTYAVLEFEKGMEFFNNYQFEAAKLNFESAHRKLKSIKLKKLSLIYTDIANFYSSWDKFNNVIGENKKVLNSYLKSEIIDRIENDKDLKSMMENEQSSFFNQMLDNQEFLKLKISRKGVIKPENVKYYLPDLLNNASRRVDEGKYDDALARIYRAVELIGQAKLLEMGMINEDRLKENKKFMIDKDSLEKRWNPKINKYLEDLIKTGQVEPDDKVLTLGRNRSFEILKMLGDKTAHKFLDNKITDLLNRRNISILAHGLEPISKETVFKLEELVMEYAYELYPDLDTYKEMSRFPKFNVR